MIKKKEPVMGLNNCSGNYSVNNRGAKLDWLLNFDHVKDKLVCTLINTEANEELLKDRPHLAFLDLSIVFKCIIGQDGDATIQMPVYNTHMRVWDVTLEELYDIAMENTPKLLEYEVEDIQTIVKELMQVPCAKEDNEPLGIDDISMYVLSNKARVDGAACILYPQLLSDIANKFHSNYYVIPSSIHEVLLVPAEDYEYAEDIKQMIREVNDAEVDVTERLSYSLYYYDSVVGSLDIV